MKNSNYKKLLAEEIILLKYQQAADLQSLKNQYHQTIIGFTPLNILKTSFESILSTSNLKTKIVCHLLSLAMNLITKNKQKTTTENPFQGIIGKILLFGVKKIIRIKS
jgi:hypothetical protein